jgi:hypothetical protein
MLAGAGRHISHHCISDLEFRLGIVWSEAAASANCLCYLGADQSLRISDSAAELDLPTSKTFFSKTYTAFF